MCTPVIENIFMEYYIYYSALLDYIEMIKTNIAGRWIVITTGFSGLFRFQKPIHISILCAYFYAFVCIHVHGHVFVSACYKHMYNVSQHKRKIPAEILST